MAAGLSPMPRDWRFRVPKRGWYPYRAGGEPYPNHVAALSGCVCRNGVAAAVSGAAMARMTPHDCVLAATWEERAVGADAVNEHGDLGLVQLMFATWLERRACRGLRQDPSDPCFDVSAGTVCFSRVS